MTRLTPNIRDSKRAARDPRLIAVTPHSWRVVSARGGTSRWDSENRDFPDYRHQHQGSLTDELFTGLRPREIQQHWFGLTTFLQKVLFSYFTTVARPRHIVQRDF